MFFSCRPGSSTPATWSAAARPIRPLGGATIASFDVSAMGAPVSGLRRVREDQRQHLDLDGDDHGGDAVDHQPGHARGFRRRQSRRRLGRAGVGGGTLQFLSGFTSARTITLNAGGGGTFDTDGNSATLSGAIGGSGNLDRGQFRQRRRAHTDQFRQQLYRRDDDQFGRDAGAVGRGHDRIVERPCRQRHVRHFRPDSGTSIGSLSGSGAVALGANTLTLSNASGTFSGAIDGTGGLTLTAGTETLSGLTLVRRHHDQRRHFKVVNGSIAKLNPDHGSKWRNARRHRYDRRHSDRRRWHAGARERWSPSGTLTVGGNLGFNSGSFYAHSDRAGRGNNSKTVVTGTATLGGNGTVVVTPQLGHYNAARSIRS